MRTLAKSADLATLRVRITALTPTDTPRWGSMTVAQMVVHLRDAFCVPLGERSVTRPPSVPPIPVSLYRWLALNFPRKWPQGVPTTPEMDQQIGGTSPAGFDADRTALFAKLGQFVQATGPWSPHPMFGALTQAQWMRWGYLHTDHHLRQFGR